MNPSSKPQPSEEERLMALLALDSQELPPGSAQGAKLAKLDSRSMSPEQIADLHAHLDAHPEAFEALVRYRTAATSAAPSSVRSWRAWFTWQWPVPRYAVALGAAALCAVVVSLSLIDGTGRSSGGVEQAYAELLEHTGTSPAATEARQQAEARLGFSGPARPSDAAALGFAAGLAAGSNRMRPAGEAAAEPSIADESTMDESMFILGQWNALLWTAGQLPEPMPPEFWARQRDRFHEFAVELEQQRRTEPAVIAHVQHVDTLLARLADRGGARTAYELSQELLLFRARFTP